MEWRQPGEPSLTAVGLPLKFLIISFLAEAGLLFIRGEEWRLKPLDGLLRAEKFAFFCASVISDEESSFSFLLGKLGGDNLQSLCFLFFWFVVSPPFCCSDSGDLLTLDRGIHTLLMTTFNGSSAVENTEQTTWPSAHFSPSSWRWRLL